nr:MAG: nonstructural protein [Microviridae sp.]
MRLHIVSVFDKAAAAYNRPWFVPALGLAVRSFTDEVNRDAADNPMFAHPSDYELYDLGFFDDMSGIFESQKPVCLTTGSVVSTKFHKE